MLASSECWVVIAPGMIVVDDGLDQEEVVVSTRRTGLVMLSQNEAKQDSSRPGKTSDTHTHKHTTTSAYLTLSPTHFFPTPPCLLA